MRLMSGLLPKADIGFDVPHVRFAPIADIGSALNAIVPLDHALLKLR
jgi:hypothetical protein